VAQPAENGHRERPDVEEDKKRAEVYAKLGELLLKNERWEEAVEAYQNGIRNHPDFPFSYEKLADALLKLKRWEEAAEACGKAIEINPNCSWHYHKLGEALLQLQRWDEAVAAYEQAIQFNPDFPWSYDKLGQALMALLKWQEAVDVFCSFIKIKADFSPAYHKLGKSWKELKKLGEDGGVLVEVIKALPKLPQAYHFMGKSLREKGLLEEAIACYKEARELAKEDAGLLVLLGEALLQSGDAEEAIACYLKAMQLQPDFTKPYHKLRSIHKFGEIQLEQSQLEKLANCYQKALTIQPDLIEIEVNLADILTQQGKIEEAINCYQNIAYKKTQVSRPDFVEKHWEFNKLGRPDFIIIGTVKGGTTSLYNYICQHPEVLPATEKEVRFFNKQFNQQFEVGKDWYFAHFPPIPAGAKFLTGEGSPTYIYEDEVAARIKKTVPDVKLIAVLRNPVDRAVSHYYMLKKLGQENRSWEKAIDGEMEVLSKLTNQSLEEGIFSYNKMGYLRWGLYVYFLQEWTRLFPKNQLLILKSEDLYQQPEQTMKQVFDFLGLPNYESGDYKNYFAGDYPGVNEKIRQRLSRFFEPHNRKLEAFLGKKLNW
jgi:tetratricopeptide (TPR) repeat protein